jgi:hypothetical protein
VRAGQHPHHGVDGGREERAIEGEIYGVHREAEALEHRQRVSDVLSLVLYHAAHRLGNPRHSVDTRRRWREWRFSEHGRVLDCTDLLPILRLP